MRLLPIRSLSLAAVALLAFAGSVAAQDKSPILNALELRQLVASASPADNQRLSAHFAALGERDSAEAKRHTAMAQSFVGNPSRSMGSGMSAHCERLATLNTQSATAAGELATYHQKLASGAPATPPSSGAGLEAGVGARSPTDQELNTLAAKASTPANHADLEHYFLSLAKRYTADAKTHASMAQLYRSNTRLAGAGIHCDRLVDLSREAANEAAGAAAMHKKLAGAGH
jgi:hypothetical protein